MFKNYLITAWRNIIKNGVFSVINIAGLALGLMSCILIMLFVREETGFDKWLTDSDRIVRMHSAYYNPDNPPFLTVRSAGNMMEAVRDYAKNEVEDGVRLIRFDSTVRKEEGALAETVTFVDGSFFNIFDLPFLHGSKDSSFNKPYDMIITEDMANRYFGKTDVVGEVMTICCLGAEPSLVPVSGVIKNLPEATHLDLDMIVYVDPTIIENNQGLNTWTSLNVYTYFKMRSGISLEQFQQRLTYWVDNESPFVKMYEENIGELATDEKVSDNMRHKLMYLENLHLRAREDAGNMGDLTPMGDKTLIITFSIVAGLILLIACINFMNLSTARVSHRAREVAMRKVLGASRGQVAVQFLGEAIALVLISLVLALALVELLLPLYNQALGRQLELNLFSDLKLVFVLLGLGLLIGLGAGSYPAIFLSGFQPAYLLRSSKGAESKTSSSLRLTLVVVQFATSITLVVCTAVIYAQTLYAQSVDVGYVSEDKLVLNIRGAGDNRQRLRHELLKLPEISSVVYSSESPTQDNENNNQFTLLDGEHLVGENPQVLLNYHDMGYGFFEAYEVNPLAGRLFSEDFGSDEIKQDTDGQNGQLTASVILNESALHKFGFTSPEQAIGKTLESGNYKGQALTIIGIVPDIYFRSIKFGVRPTAYTMNTNRLRVASLTFSTNNVAALMQKVESIWKQTIPMQPIDLQFLDEMMKAQYSEESMQTKMFSVFSLLAIGIACLGLYGLASFTTERRTREIGIRKVMGASVKDIVSLLIWQFSKPVMIANLIAWPVSIYAMLIWLESFSYRINTLWLGPICLVVGSSLLLVAWATVGGNAAKVARANPIKALRQE
ncbi:ABC transporter permease [Paraglaciecola sp. MB-3u-78]|uniref:ABC transporter permease n=1 Tax=Paraglaciecola sp. MB-3u-78 TaxID=2058332 RepID=UPI000C3462FF|nr:ABC transporter permease [Paraglaciecola sp. MB-3u-78]PKH00087.1 ABC transporter permease [Paraglaciecola sp. MB-3u-78]